jgi:hypothetical protein
LYRNPISGTDITHAGLSQQRGPEVVHAGPHQEVAMSGTEKDPRHHTRKMQKALKEIRDHLREDIEKVDEPQLKAMFETSAEVLGGLEKAFQDYERKNEPAWR